MNVRLASWNSLTLLCGFDTTITLIFLCSYVLIKSSHLHPPGICFDNILSRCDRLYLLIQRDNDDPLWSHLQPSSTVPWKANRRGNRFCSHLKRTYNCNCDLKWQLLTPNLHWNSYNGVWLVRHGCPVWQRVSIRRVTGCRSRDVTWHKLWTLSDAKHTGVTWYVFYVEVGVNSC